jgi:RimJ/RimL family protein N-acetyltransferase
MLRESDLAAFVAYRSDVERARFQGWSPMTVDESRAFLAEMAAIANLLRGEWVQLAIADAATDEILGDMGICLDADQRGAEIGFTLCRAAEGRGHATRAVEASVALLVRSAPIAAVRAVTDARNEAAIGVLERAGFRRVRERAARFKGEDCIEADFVLAP